MQAVVLWACPQEHVAGSAGSCWDSEPVCRLPFRATEPGSRGDTFEAGSL